MANSHSNLLEDRDITLLRAAYAILQQARESRLGRNPMKARIVYDNLEQTGEQLMRDIEVHLAFTADSIARQNDFHREADAVVTIIEDAVTKELTRDQAVAAVEAYMKKMFR